MKYAADLDQLWPELPYLDRFHAAATAGFVAVELPFPYEVAAKETQRALIANGLDLILISAPPPNYTGGRPGFAADPTAINRFRSDMRRVFRFAQALRVPMIRVRSGEASGALARQTLIDNLRWAGANVPSGITLTIKPLGRGAQSGGFLNDFALAADILAEVTADNVGLEYDSYQAQTLHGDAVGVFLQYRDIIRHIRIGVGPLGLAPKADLAKLVGCIEKAGYGGYVSCDAPEMSATGLT